MLSPLLLFATISLQSRSVRCTKQTRRAQAQTLPDVGEIIFKGQGDYQNASAVGYLLPSWLQYSPDAIVTAETTEDVSRIVRWAYEKRKQDSKNEMSSNTALISPVGGTHGSAGYAFSGSAAAIKAGQGLSEVGPLDKDAGTLKVGAGVKFRDMVHYLESEGYVAATGVCEDVGISGWTLGGGYSTFSKMMGLGCDNVVDLDIVLPNGTFVGSVNESNHPDLFWALRGAGHQSFGQVTSWTIKAMPMKTFVRYVVDELPCETDPTFCSEAIYKWQSLYFNNSTWRESPLDTYSFHLSRNLTSGGEKAPITITFTFVYLSDEHNAVEAMSGIMHPFIDFLTDSVPGGFNQTSYDIVNLTEILAFDDEGYESIEFGGDYSYEAKVGVYLKRDMNLKDWSILIDAALSVRELLLNGTVNGLYFVFEPYSGRIVEKESDYNSHFQRAETLGDMYFDVFTSSLGPEDDAESKYSLAMSWLASLYQGSLDEILYKYDGTVQSYVNYRNTMLGEWDDRWRALESYYGGNLCRLVEIKEKYDPLLVFDFAQGIPGQYPDGKCGQNRGSKNDLAASSSYSWLSFNSVKTRVFLVALFFSAL